MKFKLNRNQSAVTRENAFGLCQCSPQDCHFIPESLELLWCGVGHLQNLHCYITCNHFYPPQLLLTRMCQVTPFEVQRENVKALRVVLAEGPALSERHSYRAISLCTLFQRSLSRCGSADTPHWPLFPSNNWSPACREASVWRKRAQL